MTITELIKSWPACPIAGYWVNPEKRCRKCKHKGNLKPGPMYVCEYKPRDLKALEARNGRKT